MLLVGMLNISCGIFQAYGLGYDNQLGNTQTIAEHMFDVPPGSGRISRAAMYIFSDVVKFVGQPNFFDSPGVTLARYLSGLDCGSVTESEVKRNPNSHNDIKMWIFQPDPEKFAAWHAANGRAVNKNAVTFAVGR